jgi:hypothetical protein
VSFSDEGKRTWIFLEGSDHLDSFFDLRDFGSHAVRRSEELGFDEPVLVILLIEERQYSLSAFFFAGLLNIFLRNKKEKLQ